METILETERLYLRPFKASDAEDMFAAWASDEEVTKYLTWNAHKSVDVTRSVLNGWIAEYSKPERLNFAIVLKDGNKLIGGIDVVGYIGEKGTPVIGYCLSRKFWNKGIMTEACKRVLEYLFSLGYDEVRIDAFNENAGSNRVIQKCGGIRFACEKEFVPAKNKNVFLNRYIVKNPKELAK